MTLGTAARWDFDNSWVDQLGSGLSQDTARVRCDFINRLTPPGGAAFAIVAHLECLSAEAESAPLLQVTVLLTFVVDPETGVICEGLFLATSADVDLVVV